MVNLRKNLTPGPFLRKGRLLLDDDFGQSAPKINTLDGGKEIKD
jgi:hypothetical protein